MNELRNEMRKLAVRAIEDAECGAQIVITDKVLHESLIESITRQLERAHALAASA